MRTESKRSSKARRQTRRSRDSILRTASTASATVSTTNPVFPFSRISGTEPLRHAMTGVPQASASIMTSPKGSGQSLVLRAPTDLANEFHERPGGLEQRLNRLLIVAPILVIDFCRNLELSSRVFRDLDRTVESLFRRDPSDKHQVLSWLLLERMRS